MTTKLLEEKPSKKRWLRRMTSSRDSSSRSENSKKESGNLKPRLNRRLTKKTSTNLKKSKTKLPDKTSCALLVRKPPRSN